MTDQIADQWVIARNDETGMMEGFLIGIREHDESHPILSGGDTMPETVAGEGWIIVYVFSEAGSEILEVFERLEVLIAGSNDSLLFRLINEAVNGIQKELS